MERRLSPKPPFRQQSLSPYFSASPTSLDKRNGSRKPVPKRWPFAYRVFLTALIVVSATGYFIRSVKRKVIQTTAIKEREAERRSENYIIDETVEQTFRPAVDVDCKEDKLHYACWPGIYQDILIETTLYLSPDGRVMAAGAKSEESLRWSVDAYGGLQVTDSQGSIWGGLAQLHPQWQGSQGREDEGSLVFSFKGWGLRLIQSTRGYVYTGAVYDIRRFLINGTEGQDIVDLGDGNGYWAEENYWTRAVLTEDCSFVSPTDGFVFGTWENCQEPQRTNQFTLVTNHPSQTGTAGGERALANVLDLDDDGAIIPNAEEEREIRIEQHSPREHFPEQHSPREHSPKKRAPEKRLPEQYFKDIPLPLYKVHTLDSGREWYDRSGAHMLRLISPMDSTLFPAPPALKEQLIVLCENGGALADTEMQSLQGAQEKIKKKPTPIRSILIPKVQGLSTDVSTFTTQLPFEFVVIVTSEMDRPGATGATLRCKVNGIWRRAFWISWSTALCAVGGGAARAGATATVSMWMDTERITETSSFEWMPQVQYPSLWKVARGMSIKKDGWGWEQHAVSVCALIKNEAPYLQEWLEYHTALGIDNFILYDNSLVDKEIDAATAEVLHPWKLANKVKVVSWPHVAAQTEALVDCMNRNRHNTRWMTFIDVDEFIDPMPAEPVETPRERHAFLAFVEEKAKVGRNTLCMPWVNYCTKGQLEPPNGSVRKSYTGITPFDPKTKPTVHMQKPFFLAVSAISLRLIGPHFLVYTNEDIASQYKRRNGCPQKWEDPKELRLRHYRAKSRQEYVGRRKGGDSAYKNRQYTEQKLIDEWNADNIKCIPEEEAGDRIIAVQ